VSWFFLDVGVCNLVQMGQLRRVLFIYQRTAGWYGRRYWQLSYEFSRPMSLQIVKTTLLSAIINIRGELLCLEK
jgi:hypothetical protein